jgi:hypothetical protein
MRAMRQYRLFSWMILKPFVAADVLAVVDRYRCTPATLAARIGYSGSRARLIGCILREIAPSRARESKGSGANNNATSRRAAIIAGAICMML